MKTTGISENQSESYTKQLVIYLKAKLVACQFYVKLAYLRLNDESIPQKIQFTLN